jgi:hypothetical protein
LQDLIEDLSSELGGDFRETVLGMFETPARYDAWAVKNAIYVRGAHAGINVYKYMYTPTGSWH